MTKGIIVSPANRGVQVVVTDENNVQLLIDSNRGVNLEIVPQPRIEVLVDKGVEGAQGPVGPQGPQGPQGTAATVTAGTTTTGLAGTNAIVTNSGTSSAAVFDFTIPRGDTGATGATGAGVAVGGTTGQVLVKASNVNYDTTWATITGTLVYQGSWNASTNTPTLTSSVGTNGYYYVVGTSGSTNLNGITDWVVGDWAIFNGTIWQKIDNTDLVSSVNGQTGVVVLTASSVGALAIANNLSDLANTTTARTNLGLGSIATQNANNVAITGGSITGITDLAVADGGTGASTLTGYVKGSGTTPLTASATIPSSDVTGLGTMSTQNANAVAITGGTIDNTVIGGTTPVAGTFTTLTGNSTSQFGRSSANYVQIVGAATTVAPNISAQGGDTNIPLRLSSKNDATIYGVTNGVISFDTYAPSGSVNYLRLRGNASGTGAAVESFGSDSNVDIILSTKGTGALRTYTNSNQQLAVTNTASAVNYVQATGAATGGVPTISAQGSDSNVSLFLNAKGTGNVFLQVGGANVFQAAGSSTSANRILTQANNAGTAPAIQSVGSDTNIDINLTTKGTGAFVVNTGGGPQFRVVNTASAVNYFQANGSATGVQPGFRVDGSDTNISTAFTTKGTGSHFFSTNAFAQTQLVVSHTASAVNYVQITGAATGAGVTLSAQGSDSNVQFYYVSKGTFPHSFLNSSGNEQFRIAPTASAVNYFQTNGAITGFGPVLSAQGTDTNIPLVLQPKGTGALQAQQTDSTATGGNARGSYATDLQRSRSSASNVASGGNSFIGSGNSNSVTSSLSGCVAGDSNVISGYSSFIGAGNSNTASNVYSSVTTGVSNTASNFYTTVVNGNTNTAAGYYNFIGNGQSNSGTSGSAVTTQSATMNGTTAVTLSGSNASIKVGQYITGTSIASDTYVAAISGTSLTLSKVASGSSTSTLSFFTPHGVVVGGGNNQATGSYSFIGGGGDAGTAGNRNVASGDYSTVVGGRGNQATASGAFVGGGGFLSDSSSYTNTASGNSSAVVGGISNTASGQGSFIGGGFSNSANSRYSFAFGRASTTRSISGSFAISPQDGALGGGLGQAQSEILILGRQTTDATATVLTSDSNAAGTGNQVILPNNSAYFFTGEVVAGVTGGGNTKGWTIEGVIKRGANAAATTLVGSTVTSMYADVGAATWTIAVTADTTNGGLAVTFTGQASTTIRVVCQVRSTEMTF